MGKIRKSLTITNEVGLADATTSTPESNEAVWKIKKYNLVLVYRQFYNTKMKNSTINRYHYMHYTEMKHKVQWQAWTINCLNLFIGSGQNYYRTHKIVATITAKWDKNTHQIKF